LDPILIVTKMACTLNFLHYLRFIPSSLSLTSCIQTSLLIFNDYIVLYLFVNFTLLLALYYFNMHIVIVIMHTSFAASLNNLGIYVVWLHIEIVFFNSFAPYKEVLLLLTCYAGVTAETLQFSP
jgi:hypothetical protein